MTGARDPEGPRDSLNSRGLLPRLDSTSLLSFALLLCATAAVPPRVRVVLLGSEVLFAAVLRIRFRRQNQVATGSKAGSGNPGPQQQAAAATGAASVAHTPAASKASSSTVIVVDQAERRLGPTHRAAAGSVERSSPGPFALLLLWTLPARSWRQHQGPNGRHNAGHGVEVGLQGEAADEQELPSPPGLSNPQTGSGAAACSSRADTIGALLPPSTPPVVMGLLRGGGLLSGLGAIVGRQRRRRAGSVAAQQRSPRGSQSGTNDAGGRLCGPGALDGHVAKDGDVGRTKHQPVGSADAQPPVLQQAAAPAAALPTAAASSLTGARRRFWRRRRPAVAATANGFECPCPTQQGPHACASTTSGAAEIPANDLTAALQATAADSSIRTGSAAAGSSSSKLQLLALMAVVDGAGYNDAAARTQMLASRLLDPREGHVPLLQGGHLLSQWFAGLAGPHQLSLGHLEQLLTYLLLPPPLAPHLQHQASAVAAAAPRPSLVPQACGAAVPPRRTRSRAGLVEAEAEAVVAAASALAEELAGVAGAGSLPASSPDIQRLAWQLMEALELPPQPTPLSPLASVEPRQAIMSATADGTEAAGVSADAPLATGRPAPAIAGAAAPGRRRGLTRRQRRALAKSGTLSPPQPAAGAVHTAIEPVQEDASGPPHAPAAVSQLCAASTPSTGLSTGRTGDAAGGSTAASTAAGANATGRLLSASTDTLVASYRPLAFYAVMEAVAGATHLALTTRCGGLGLGWRLLGTTPAGTAAVYEWQPHPQPLQRPRRPTPSAPGASAGSAAAGAGAAASTAHSGGGGEVAPAAAEPHPQAQVDAGAEAAGEDQAPPPLVFLHGIGMGLTPYLRVLGRLAAVAEASAASSHRPPQRLLAVQYKHVSMRITANIPAPHEVAADVAAFMGAQGVRRMSVLAHSYGTLVASALLKLAAASPAAPAVSRLTLVDPVCFAMFLPHLTRNGLYQQPVTPTPAPATPEPQQPDAQPRQPPLSEGAGAAGVPEAAARGPGAQPAVPDRDASTTVQPAAVGAAGAGAGVAAGVRLGAGVPLQLRQQAGQPRDRLGAALGRRLVRILLRGLVVAEFHCAVALRRRLDWARVNLWPSELPRGRDGGSCSCTHVFLSGRDNLVPAAEVRQILANRAALLGPGGGPHPEVHFHTELGHGGFLGDLDWQARVIGAALGVPQGQVHATLQARVTAAAASSSSSPAPSVPAPASSSSERSVAALRPPAAGVLRWRRGIVRPQDDSSAGCTQQPREAENGAGVGDSSGNPAPRTSAVVPAPPSGDDRAINGSAPAVAQVAAAGRANLLLPLIVRMLAARGGRGSDLTGVAAEPSARREQLQHPQDGLATAEAQIESGCGGRQAPGGRVDAEAAALGAADGETQAASLPAGQRRRRWQQRRKDRQAQLRDAQGSGGKGGGDGANNSFASGGSAQGTDRPLPAATDNSSDGSGMGGSSHHPDHSSTANAVQHAGTRPSRAMLVALAVRTVVLAASPALTVAALAAVGAAVCNRGTAYRRRRQQQELLLPSTGTITSNSASRVQRFGPVPAQTFTSDAVGLSAQAAIAALPLRWWLRLQQAASGRPGGTTAAAGGSPLRAPGTDWARPHPAAGHVRDMCSAGSALALSTAGREDCCTERALLEPAAVWKVSSSTGSSGGDDVSSPVRGARLPPRRVPLQLPLSLGPAPPAAPAAAAASFTRASKVRRSQSPVLSPAARGALLRL